MYGLNNNTGTTQSQENNYLATERKKATNATKTKQITNNIKDIANAVGGFTDSEALHRIGKIAGTMAMFM